MDLATRLGFGENLVIALLGMLVVFAILLILFVVLKIFGVVFSQKVPKESKKKVEQVVEIQQKNEEIAPASEATDDTELIAVISAAIAASLNKSASEIRVVSFRKAKTK